MPNCSEKTVLFFFGEAKAGKVGFARVVILELK